MKRLRTILAVTLLATLVGAPRAGSASAAAGSDAFAFCLCSHASPCDNEDADSGCLNSAGIGGTLSFSGSTSVAADDLFLSASDLPLLFNTALLIASPNQKLPTPFGAALVCVGDPLGRIQVAGGFEPVPFGPVVSSINDSSAAFTVGAGDTVYLQAWYRDIGSNQPCGAWQPWNMTNGIVANLVQ